MALVVWKATLQWPADSQQVAFPEGSQLLTVQMQGRSLCIWALVNPDMPPVKYDIRTCGTGHQVDPDVGSYLGTFQLHDGNLVFHAFGRLAR